MFMQKISFVNISHPFSPLEISPAALFLLQLGELHNLSAFQEYHGYRQIPHTAGL